MIEYAFKSFRKDLERDVAANRGRKVEVLLRCKQQGSEVSACFDASVLARVPSDERTATSARTRLPT